jgi:hypothetical protein
LLSGSGSCCRGCGSGSALAPGIPFSNASRFSSKASKIIELGPPHLTAPNHIDPVQHAGVKRKYPLDAYTKARFSDGYGLPNSRVFSGDYNSFKDLDSFLITLFDLYVYANRVTGLKLRDIIAELPSFNVFNYWIHVYYLDINLFRSGDLLR